MKPEQFICEQGLEKAREVVEKAPDRASYYRDMNSVCSPNEILYYVWFGCALLVKDQDKGWIKSIYHKGNEFILDQLEPLHVLRIKIDFIDAVNSKGGLEETKKLINTLPIGRARRDLARAVECYESIYGGGDA